MELEDFRGKKVAHIWRPEDQILVIAFDDNSCLAVAHEKLIVGEPDMEAKTVEVKPSVSISLYGPGALSESDY